MTEEEQKLAEEAAAAEAAAKAEAEAKAEEEAKAAEALLEQEIDYKTLAEAEKVRADAAEALIIKNKNIAKRKGDGEGETLSEERVLELIRLSKETDESPEAKALAEAQKNLKLIQAKNAEIARALQNKSNPARDVAGTQRDGDQVPQPKLPEGSPLKSYKHEGNGVYSKKLANGKTLYIDSKAPMGGQKKWVA